MTPPPDVSLRAYAWNLRYAEALTSDLEPESWTRGAGPGLENHATWTIGHLVTGSDLLAEDLGLAREVSEEWRHLFERRGPGDPRLPDPDPAAYPALPDVVRELRRQHERVADAWRRLDEARLAGRVEWRFAGELPTLADLGLFMAVTHEAMHLGQLAAWRRALGLPSALAALGRAP
ncbi:MAG: DinB family protein [bacterium]